MVGFSALNVLSNRLDAVSSPSLREKEIFFSTYGYPSQDL
jgi:hypothetical protein